MPDTLKPCPFCGGQAFLRRYDSSYKTSPTTILDAWGVHCSNNCCNTQRFKDEIFHDESGAIIINHNGAQEAIDAWNSRVGEGEKG